jgi:hypothetical protein
MTENSERRDGPRIDLRLRVRYAAESLAGEAEASDLSPSGLRFESEAPLKTGATLRLMVDAGDDEELEAQGTVSWCRPRSSPAGKTMYDVGIGLDAGWLAQERGPLGAALARIFVLEQYEPARAATRAAVSLQAFAEKTPEWEFDVSDLSLGGMRLHTQMPGQGAVKSGQPLSVRFEETEGSWSIRAEVVWVAGDANEGAEHRMRDVLGVQFQDLGSEEAKRLETICQGAHQPKRILLSFGE